MRKIIKLSKLNVSDRDSVIKLVKKNGYVVLRGLFERSEISNSLKSIKNNFNHTQDNSSLAGSPKQIFSNFQKLCIGSSAVSGEKIYRFHRIIYNPVWSDDIYNLKKIFLKFNKIRNIILGFEENFCIDKPEKNMWSACRILQYPVGGGHMSAHKDYILKSVSKINFNNMFYQLILLITEKGTDFFEGGAYISKDNKLIDIEKNTLRGDILIYKTNIVHGVEEIDPSKKLSLDSINGRVVLMNSLYQNYSKFRPKDKYFKNKI